MPNTRSHKRRGEKLPEFAKNLNASQRACYSRTWWERHPTHEDSVASQEREYRMHQQGQCAADERLTP
jgi:hypothetical protein